MSSPPDWQSLYPFASHELLVGGQRYHYLDEGTGPVLLLVHGNPTWSFYWREIVRGLRGKYRLIVPDHIGCGLSAKPSRREYSYRLAQRITRRRGSSSQRDASGGLTICQVPVCRPAPACP